MYDTEILEMFRKATNKHIWNYIRKSANSFEAYRKLCKLFENTPAREMIQINRDWHTIFKIGYNQLFFVTKYEQLIDDYATNECKHSDEYIRTNFLAKIHDLENPDGPLYSFFRNAISLPPAQRNYETTKQMFLDVDLSKQGKTRKCTRFSEVLDAYSFNTDNIFVNDNLVKHAETISVNVTEAVFKKKSNTYQ